MPWNVQSDTIDPPTCRPDIRPGEEQLPAPGRLAYCVAGLLRLFVSGATTSVVAATFPQSANPLVSFLVGVGALSAIQQAATLAPLMVKSAAQASLGGVVQEAQQRSSDQLQQQPVSGQSNGVAAQPNQTDAGGMP